MPLPILHRAARLGRIFAEISFSPSAAGLYMILIAGSIGTATFIENDFGTSSAQALVFKTKWFELLLLLFGISLVINIFRFRMIPQRKWGVLTFHSAILLILAGAGVTRYWGFEGMMHIREGSASNHFLSSETYLQFKAQTEHGTFSFEEPVLFSSRGSNHFREAYRLGSKEVTVEVTGFLPNPKEVMVEDPVAGIPVVKIVMGGVNGREEYHLSYGQVANLHGTRFSFGQPAEPGSFVIDYAGGQLVGRPGQIYSVMQMASGMRDTVMPEIDHPLALRSLYQNNSASFVFADFMENGRVEMESADRKMTSTSVGGVQLAISSGGRTVKHYIYGAPGAEGRPRTFELPGIRVQASYGAKKRFLPFSLYLRDFILERYPGTQNPSSYASEVTLKDPRTGLEREQRIYMNHILDYEGYRFFQSSYDQDEGGTYLSVNHDAPGTWLSYIGYFLLTLGMIITLFTPSSRFRQLAVLLKRIRSGSKAGVATLVLACTLNGFLAAQSGETVPVSRRHADKFGKNVVQDFNGRLKPINTLSREVMRKLSRKETYDNLSAEQVILGMALQPSEWYHAPLIRLGKHPEIRKMLGVDVPYASYADFFHTDGSYKLSDAVRAAYNKESRDRGVLDKELIKVDEKVNICSMVFSGNLFRIFPVPGDTSNHWRSPADATRHGASGVPFIDQFYPAYLDALRTSRKNDQWEKPDRLLQDLGNYQQEYGSSIYPVASRISAELLLNRLDIFNRLRTIYGLLTLAFLTLLFLSVFQPDKPLDKIIKITWAILLLAFTLHTFGLAIRWYVSQRAPWSNGYESMIYIGWTTVLAGLLFSRRAAGALTATSALAATIMMVAGLSWLDPEITPLVPVLKSYWLTIHVSLEAGSYGFLMLGAIIGVINLVLMALAGPSNRQRIYRMVKEMSYISEMTLIGGLFMISTGTYLGGIWANESWGRYWGWDAKETWALVTILVYSFILHMRFIPRFRGLYAFNVASLFGWASVVMTYFGVNYYLSGLHSYAAGDPVPIPDFVYYTVISLVVISLLAWWKHRKNEKLV